MNISYFEKARSKEPITAEINELFDEIKTGVFKNQIDAIRQLKKEGKDYKAEKEALPGFTPSCICKGGRGKEYAVKHTGTIVIDLDYLGEHLDIVRSIAYSLPYTWRAFVSPSGEGLKIFVKTNAAIETHDEAMKQVSQYYAEELDVRIDPSGKDIARLCFMSSDKDLFSNDKAEIFKIKNKVVEKKTLAENNPSDKRDELTDGKIKELFRECVTHTNKHKAFVEGERNNYVYYLANNCNRKGMKKETALELILKNYGYDHAEAKRCVDSAYKNTEEHGKYANTPSLPEPVVYKINYTDIELANMEITHRFLLENYISSTGTSVLCGVPDVAKSQLARQLCLHICCGKDEFLGKKLLAKYGSALIVSTEDSEDNISFLLKKQLDGLNAQPTGNLKFLFASGLDQNQIIIEIENHLTQHPSDLVIIDCLGDLFDNDMNNNVNMRKTVGAFDYLAQKHRCHVMFLHHVTKSSYSSSPSQKNILGGSGLTQKVRLALQLSNGEGNEKFLSVLKGNYLKREEKITSKILKFDEEFFLFTDSGMTEATDSIGADNKRDTKEDRLQRLADEIFDGKSLSYTEFVSKHQQINSTGKAQAQRDHKALKELDMIIKDEKKWKLNDEGIASATQVNEGSGG